MLEDDELEVVLWAGECDIWCEMGGNNEEVGWWGRL